MVWILAEIGIALGLVAFIIWWVLQPPKDRPPEGRPGEGEGPPGGDKKEGGPE